MYNFFTNPNTHILALIILIFGILGGYASTFLAQTDAKPTKYQNKRGILLGILAASVVPVFLKMLSSDLLKDAETDAQHYFVFAGFCAIMALFADKFLNGIGSNFLNKLSALETQVAEAKKNADQAMENSSVDLPSTEATEGDISEPTDASEMEATEEESASESFNLNQRGAQKPPTRTSRDAKPAPAPRIVRAPRDLIIDALRGQNRRTKTAEAVAKIAGLSVAMTESWLLDLEKSGVAKRFSTDGGGVFWKAI
jgi:hypothetical protein